MAASNQFESDNLIITNAYFSNCWIYSIKTFLKIGGKIKIMFIGKIPHMYVEKDKYSYHFTYANNKPFTPFFFLGYGVRTNN